MKSADARSFERNVPANVRSLAMLRADFRVWVDGYALDRMLRRDLVLTMSEIAAAALQSHQPGRGTLRARAWTDPDAVVLEVVDSNGSVLDARTRVIDQGESGRSLSVVASLADVLTVDDSHGATSIRARVSW